MKNVLITGDSGYIGSHLKQMIIKTGKQYNVQCLDLNNADINEPSTLLKVGFGNHLFKMTTNITRITCD